MPRGAGASPDCARSSRKAVCRYVLFQLRTRIPALTVTWVTSRHMVVVLIHEDGWVAAVGSEQSGQEASASWPACLTRMMAGAVLRTE